MCRIIRHEYPRLAEPSDQPSAVRTGARPDTPVSAAGRPAGAFRTFFPVFGAVSIAAGVLAVLAAALSWTPSVYAQTTLPPEIVPGGPFTAEEGTTPVATLTATDNDTAQNQLTWSIPASAVGGADAGEFTLSSAGVLAFAAAKDYENPDDTDTDRIYEVTVEVSDGTDSDTAVLEVALLNVTELTTISGEATVTFAENSWGRVATFTASSEEDRDGIVWALGGGDAGDFSIDSPAGALRFDIDPVAPKIFPEPPDFEAPADGYSANTYELTLLASAGTALWQWERSVGRNAWAAIDGASAASYTPAAADTGTFLRVTATYTDEHGTGKSVGEVAPNVVTGPLLTGLTAETVNSLAESSQALYPAFSPETLHYGIGCNATDTMTLTLSSASDVRVAVDGVQAASAPETVSVAVSAYSDVSIRVTDASGGGTTYFVHCLTDTFFDYETVRFPGTDVFDDLILLNQGGHFVAMDHNGVPRFRRSVPDLSRFAIRFYRVGADGAYRYAVARGGNPKSTYTILDEDLEVVDDGVTTVSPLTHGDQHDFQLLENGNYLMMAYEPATRDLSGLDLPYPDGVDVSAVDVEDSAVQIVTPGGEAVFNWNSWDHMALEDCVQHRFPVTLSKDPEARDPNPDYAHINGSHHPPCHDLTFKTEVTFCVRGVLSPVFSPDPAAGGPAWGFPEHER